MPCVPPSARCTPQTTAYAVRSPYGGRLAAAPRRQLLLQVAQVRHCGAGAVVRAPRRRRRLGRRPRPFLWQLQVLHRHGPRRAFLHAVDRDDDASGDGLRLRLARLRRRQPLVPDACQREPDHPRRPPPPLRSRPPVRWCPAGTRRSRLGGAAERATVGGLVAAVPLCPEHSGLPELMLQHAQRRWQQERQQDGADALSREAERAPGVVMEDTAALPPVPRTAVPEGQGPAAVPGAASQGRAGEPGARVHVELGVVPWQCRHGGPRRHPLLQEVQRPSLT